MLPVGSWPTLAPKAESRYLSGMARRYWLFKSDPDAFGLPELAASADQTTLWDGVRNYQARNLLRDEIKLNDGVLFYHSQQKPPGVVATARVVRASYPDPTQFDAKARYYDAKSLPSNPRWFVVDIKLEKEFTRKVTLPEMREMAELKDMVLLAKSRLSVQPVTPAEWRAILRRG
jgi:predicted RNA-binding protein with PUA-like domain